MKNKNKLSLEEKRKLILAGTILLYKIENSLLKIENNILKKIK